MSLDDFGVDAPDEGTGPSYPDREQCHSINTETGERCASRVRADGEPLCLSCTTEMGGYRVEQFDDVGEVATRIRDRLRDRHSADPMHAYALACAADTHREVWAIVAAHQDIDLGPVTISREECKRIEHQLVAQPGFFEKPKCEAVTAAGRRCTNNQTRTGLCGTHLRADSVARVDEPTDVANGGESGGE